MAYDMSRRPLREEGEFARLGDVGVVGFEMRGGSLSSPPPGISSLLFHILHHF